MIEPEKSACSDDLPCGEPTPGRASRMEEVYGRWSPVYDLVFRGIVRRGHRVAFQLLDPQRGQDILEVGVGTGLTLEHYPAGTRLTGVDISEKMLRHARSRAKRLPDLEIQLEKGDARQLRFDDDSFDAVLAANVLTAVEDPYQVCMEIRRVLKPGGRLVTVCNSTAEDEKNLWVRLRRMMSPVFWRIGFTTALDIPDLVTRCGFEIRQHIELEPLKTHSVVEAIKV